jgi:hypothetical protein
MREKPFSVPGRGPPYQAKIKFFFHRQKIRPGRENRLLPIAHGESLVRLRDERVQLDLSGFPLIRILRPHFLSRVMVLMR